MTTDQAKAKLRAAKFRQLASWQRGQYAQSHREQASKPIYPGQGSICIGKAEQAECLADVNDAHADVILAEAGL